MRSEVETTKGMARPAFRHQYDLDSYEALIAALCESTRNAVENLGTDVAMCRGALIEILKVLKRMDRRLAKRMK